MAETAASRGVSGQWIVTPWVYEREQTGMSAPPSKTFVGFISYHTCPKTGVVTYERCESARNIRMENSPTTIGEMYPSYFSPNGMQRSPKGWPDVRAQFRVQRACATRLIETGDSSTPLRMTCFAIATGETLSPHLRQNCHPEDLH